jgi:hypothetical protein
VLSLKARIDAIQRLVKAAEVNKTASLFHFFLFGLAFNKDFKSQ